MGAGLSPAAPNTNYGLDVTGLTIGKTGVDITMKFGHTDAGTNVD